MSKEEQLEQEAQEQAMNEKEQNTEAKAEDTQEEVQEEVKEPTLEEQLAEQKDKYLRLYSEFENFRRRTIKEKDDLRKTAAEKVVVDLLNVVDDFERAMQANEKAEDIDQVKEGFTLIYNKFNKTLNDKGLEAIESNGATFDTEYHEAVTEFPAPSEDMKGKVIDTATKGYTLNGKVIRFAKVVVGK